MPRQMSNPMLRFTAMKNYAKLLLFLRGHRKILFLAVGIMFFGSFFEVFQFSMFVPMIDRIFTDKPMILPAHLPEFLTSFIEKLNGINPRKLFRVLPFVFLAGLLTKLFLTFCYQYLMNSVSQRVMRGIRLQLYEKIQTLSLEYFSKKRTGELISRITNDVLVIDNAVSYALADLFRQSFLIFMYVLTALIINPQAALVIFIIFPILIVPMSKIGRRLRKISKGTQEKVADINSILLETISGIKIVKAFCTEGYEINRFRERNQQYYKLRMQSIKRLILISPITEVVAAMAGVFIMLWLGRSVMDGDMSLGFFILFFGSIMSVISPAKKLGNANAIIQQGLSASERIYDVLEAHVVVDEKSDPIILGPISSEIRLKEVNFHYHEETGMVLNGINLEVKKGEMVAIVGPTGTGKTTLVNLIPRFYDVTSGCVTVDSVDIKDVSFKSLRDQIGIVSQESVLFNDTVRNNIAYGMKAVTNEQIENAAKKAHAHEFVSKMTDRYDTIVGERGFRLSGGEKQRITIARAILKNAPVLILDEATSHLDSESESFIQEALSEFMQGRTVVAIAHRLSTIKKADKIVVLDKGHIVGEGSHQQLLKTCELYKKLYEMQFCV